MQSGGASCLVILAVTVLAGAWRAGLRVSRRGWYRSLVQTVLRFAATLLLLTATAGCTDRSGPTAPQGTQLGVPFELGIGESVVIASEPLEIVLQRVTDSRCPADVYCIWAGQLAAALQLRIGGGQAAALELGTVIDRAKTVSGYRIDLLDISAQSHDGPTTYRARLLVTK